MRHAVVLAGALGMGGGGAGGQLQRVGQVPARGGIGAAAADVELRAVVVGVEGGLGVAAVPVPQRRQRGADVGGVAGELVHVALARVHAQHQLVFAAAQRERAAGVDIGVVLLLGA